MTLHQDLEKNGKCEVEHVTSHTLVNNPNADYSGAVSKTDEVEIALVRKLDFRIMPTLWAMYFL